MRGNCKALKGEAYIGDGIYVLGEGSVCYWKREMHTPSNEVEQTSIFVRAID